MKLCEGGDQGERSVFCMGGVKCKVLGQMFSNGDIEVMQLGGGGGLVM